MYKGIYLPSLSGKLQDERLELAYQKYAHRQRQRSLMLVNSADILLKGMALLKVLCYIDSEEVTGSKDNSSLNDTSNDSLTSTSSPTPTGDSLVDQTCYLVQPEEFAGLLAWLSVAAAINIALALVSWWQCYANNFLHWGALATWVLLLLQGNYT